VPAGIDEAMSFAEIMKNVENMDYDCIVFDTAPTGHTLRLLSFPTMLEKAMDKVMELKNKMGGMAAGLASMMGGQAGAEDAMMEKLTSTRETVQKVCMYACICMYVYCMCL
jgi:arsenite-transporting ATPase